ncbi:uncharacterized protein LOC114526020 [Dendronephthya gigantea]|uniref:uncharacterized protein LOC114526020 n=1 Tax=Dendronephthya gigantea TaxID=151771 RepID=UPI00106CFA30|nr:uncharacterized protein LOC114526020 [Dendronephthya gigantea]
MAEKMMILVDNQSAIPVTLFLHKNWNHWKFLSISKIVEPGKNYFHTNGEALRFELSARFDGRTKSTFCSLTTCEEEMVLRIRGDDLLYVKKEKLKHEEKQICLRRQNMNKDVSASGNKNLYEILGLNMKEVRKKPFEEQNEMIKKAYRSQLLRWHPGKNPENGDKTICHEIINAYKILKDPKARAAYNIVADYDTAGWLSKARWGAVFKPECYSDEQKKQYRKRMGLLILSSVLVTAGIGLTFVTAGMARPVVLGMMAASGGIIGGGISSGLRTINREAIEKVSSFKKYFISLVVGAVGGAIMGVGVDGKGIISVQASLERQISLRMTTSAFRSLVTSLTNNLDTILAGGPKPTWKQLFLHVVLDALMGGIAGATGGLTENMLEDVVSPDEALTAFESVSSGTSLIVEDSATVATTAFTEYFEERLDDGVKNKFIVDHLKKAVVRSAQAVNTRVHGFRFKAGVKDIRNVLEAEVKGESSHQNEETKQDSENTSVAKNMKETIGEGMSRMSGNNENTGTGDDLGKDVEHSNNETNEVKYAGSAGSIENGDKHECEAEDLLEITSFDDIDCRETNAQTAVNQKIKYISKGYWFSKMLVDYKVNGRSQHEEVEYSEGSILLPNNATNIEIRFQVMRFPGVWCDVKKYDRFKSCWVKTHDRVKDKDEYKPHIFKFRTPISCTFTLAGNLYYEKVVKITNDEIYDSDDNVECAQELTSGIADERASVGFAKGPNDSWCLETDVLHDENKKELASLEWVESFKSFYANENRGQPRLEIVCKLGKVPCTADIVKFLGEKMLPFVTYKEFSKTEWFESNIFDENFEMKAEFEDKLSRLSWVRKFYVGFDDKKEQTWQIYITHAYDQAPSMVDLKEIFGVNIASFVNFIRERGFKKDIDGRKKIPFPPSDFLRGPRSGDAICTEEENNENPGVENLGCGTLGILAARSFPEIKHYAVTAYHVCYDKTFPSNIDITMKHKKLKKDFEKGSRNCVGVVYQYIDGERRRLGKFSRGLYNDRNDIALIELARNLNCDDALAFFKEEGIETALASKKDVAKCFKKLNGNVRVRRIGSTEEQEGKLISTYHKDVKTGMNCGFYMIEEKKSKAERGAEGETDGENATFAKKGDSGSLVYMICNGDKKIIFAYLSNANFEEGVYYCPNLKSSLQDLCPNNEVARVFNPCVHECGFQ